MYIKDDAGVAGFGHIRRAVFNAVADRVYNDDKLRSHVEVCYEGTSLYGVVKIEACPGYEKEFKEALAIFVEEFCH